MLWFSECYTNMWQMRTSELDLPPPPSFLRVPSDLAVPLERWLMLFHDYFLALGHMDLAEVRKCALLCHSLGQEDHGKHCRNCYKLNRYPELFNMQLMPRQIKHEGFCSPTCDWPVSPPCYLGPSIRKHKKLSFFYCLGLQQVSVSSCEF